MSQKYVPSNVFLKCDKGVTPCRLQIVRPRAKLYGEEQWATENDAVPMVNVSSFGLCSVTQKPCLPLTMRWQNTLPGALKIMVLGSPESPLVDDSFLPCSAGGKIDIFFTQAAVSQALANDRQADAAHEVAEEAKHNSLLLFGAAVLVGVAVVGLTIATGGAALPLLALAGEAALTGAAVGAGVGAVAGGVQGYADGGWQGAASGAGMGLLTGAAMGAAGGAAVAVGGLAAGGLMLASAGVFGLGALADGYALYKQPSLRNGLVLVGDVVILAGGRLAHEAVKGLTAEPVAEPVAEPIYESASTKPRGMPLSGEEVAARFGRAGTDLVSETQAESLRIGETQSGNKRGPVLSGVKDPLTGETHYGQNVNSVPEDLHPVMAKRVQDYQTALEAGEVRAPEADLLRAGQPGTHSEVVALDKALKAREAATGRPATETDLSEMLLHNRSLRPNSLGEGVPPRCAHCWHITNGVRIIGND